MSLSFPNRSRSYDERRRQVRFLGHVGMASVPFRIDADALLMTQGADSAGEDETTCLAAFDTKRAIIEQAAARAYTSARKTVYVLTNEDLH
jgi:hypothetical protein